MCIGLARLPRHRHSDLHQIRTRMALRLAVIATISRLQSFSLPKASFNDSVFRPYITIIPMYGDGNCGFRAIAHGLFERQENWHGICEDLLKYLQSFGQSDTNSYALAARTTFGQLENSLKWCRLGHHSAQTPVSKWFNDECHGQLAADLCNTFIFNAEAIEIGRAHV